jgi:hypothetical protein
MAVMNIEGVRWMEGVDGTGENRTYLNIPSDYMTYQPRSQYQAAWYGILNPGPFPRCIESYDIVHIKSTVPEHF